MKDDRQSLGLRGAVEKICVDVAQYVEEDGRWIERPWYSRETVFNRAGNTLEDSFIMSDGQVRRMINDYDAGKLLSTRTYDQAGNTIDEVNYAYDDAVKRVSEQHSTGGGAPISTTSYSYDARGRKTKTLVYERPVAGATFMIIEGTDVGVPMDTVKRIVTRYDEQDEVIGISLHNGQGELVKQVEIERDTHGNILNVKQLRGDQPFGSRLSDWIADADERFTDEQRAELDAAVKQAFGPGTQSCVQTYKYDDEHRRVGSEQQIVGVVTHPRTTAHVERGDKAEEVIPSGASEERRDGGTYRREYDAHGNWTQEVVLLDSGSHTEGGATTPQYVTRRTITYY